MEKLPKSRSKNLRLAKKPDAAKRETQNQSSVHAAETSAGSDMTGTTDKERRQFIATAAYFRAERRNFVPGFELDDWLESGS